MPSLFSLNPFFERHPAALPAVKHAVNLACAAAFLCALMFISNTTPLYILAFFGIASFFLPERNTPSLYLGIFLIYFLYLTLSDIFLFPDSNGFAFYRKMLLAFLGGLAVFYAQKKRQAFFTCQIAAYLALLFLVYGVVYHDSFMEKFFYSRRLGFTATHPNIFAAYASVALLSVLAYILHRFGPANPPAAPGPQTLRQCRLPRALEKITLPAAFFLVFFSAVLLLATGSRGAIFAVAIVSSGSILIFLFKRFGLIRAAGLFAGLCALFVALWAAAPQSDFKERMRGRIVQAALNPWQEQTIQSRIPMWHSAVCSVARKPFFGNGPQTFQRSHEAYVQERYDELVDRFGADWVAHDTAVAVHAHNQFLMALSEQGGIGCLLFTTLFLYPAVYALRKRQGYGVIIPIISYYFIQLMVEVLFHGGRNGSFSVTVFFMILGYFAGITGAERRQPQP